MLDEMNSRVSITSEDAVNYRDQGVLVSKRDVKNDKMIM